MSASLLPPPLKPTNSMQSTTALPMAVYAASVRGSSNHSSNVGSMDMPLSGLDITPPAVVSEEVVCGAESLVNSPIEISPSVMTIQGGSQGLMHTTPQFKPMEIVTTNTGVGMSLPISRPLSIHGHSAVNSQADLGRNEESKPPFSYAQLIVQVYGILNI